MQTVLCVDAFSSFFVPLSKFLHAIMLLFLEGGGVYERNKTTTEHVDYVSSKSHLFKVQTALMSAEFIDYPSLVQSQLLMCNLNVKGWFEFSFLGSTAYTQLMVASESCVFLGVLNHIFWINWWVIHCVWLVRIADMPS